MKRLVIKKTPKLNILVVFFHNVLQFNVPVAVAAVPAGAAAAGSSERAE